MELTFWNLDALYRFEHWDIRILELFRVSYFEFNFFHAHISNYCLNEF